MAADKDKHVRSILPVPDVRKSELTPFDTKDPESRFPPIEPMLLPKGAPNVLVILLDDGFGSSSAFGGPCETPVAEKLAANGLKFTRFNTCAPAHRDGAAAGAPTIHRPARSLMYAANAIQAFDEFAKASSTRTA